MVQYTISAFLITVYYEYRQGENIFFTWTDSSQLTAFQ